MERCIRETFYNKMFDIVATSNWITEDALKHDQKTHIALIILSVTEILESIPNTNNNNSIQLTENVNITTDNCPTEFLNLFRCIIKIRHAISNNENDIIKVKELCMIKLDLLPSNTNAYNIEINTISDNLLKYANKIYKKHLFKTIIDAMIDTLYPPTNINEIHRVIVRDSFYQLMVNEVIDNNTITKEALENCAPHIFFDLSAFTLIAACIMSKKEYGLVLMDGSMLTKRNCPSIYKNFLIPVIDIKDEICDLTSDEIVNLKLLCSTNPDISFDDNIRTSELMNITTKINAISTKISQDTNFKTIISTVIQFCIDIK